MVHPAFILYWVTHLLFAFLVPLLLGVLTFHSGPRARLWFFAGIGYAAYLVLLFAFPSKEFSMMRALQTAMLWSYIACLLGILLAELRTTVPIGVIAGGAVMLTLLQCSLLYVGKGFAEQLFQSVFVLTGDMAVAWLAALLVRRVPSKSLLFVSLAGILVAAATVLRIEELLFGSGRLQVPDLSWKASAVVLSHLTAIVFLNIGYAGFILEQVERREAGAREGQRVAEESQMQIARLLDERDQMVMMNSQFAALNGMSVFAASIIHEITQPIQALVLAVHDARRLAGGNGRMQAALDFISQQAVECDVIIQSLRKIMSRGRTEVQTCDLTALLLDIVPILGSESKRRKICFETEIAGPALHGRINPVLFKRIVFNLATNALEALQAENVQDGMMAISLRRDGAAAVIEVTDNAHQTVGIDDLNFETLAGSKKPTGVGLGLMLCSRIAESWDGKLTAKREEADGSGRTVFSLTIPLSDY